MRNETEPTNKDVLARLEIHFKESLSNPDLVKTYMQALRIIDFASLEHCPFCGVSLKTPQSEKLYYDCGVDCRKVPEGMEW